jgi:uncharacterized membrane protein YfcA
LANGIQASEVAPEYRKLMYVFVLLVGLCAGAVSGVVGTGSSILLLPVLVLQYGPKQAVPIMAIAALMANIAKVWAYWREVDWRAFMAFSVTGVPAAALGARTLLIMPSSLLDAVLGTFFLAMIPMRRWLQARAFKINLATLAFAGAGVGYLTGIVLSTGPLSVPAFTAYGLVKGAFLSTEAASSLAILVGKVATFQHLGALPYEAIIQGLVVGASVMAGTFIGKSIVQRISIHAFQHLLDLMLLCSGATLIWAAFQHA